MYCRENLGTFLIPVLEQLLNTFPFVIKGFHSDNGSEYINKQVAKLLEKLLIEFTKSRADTPMIMRWQKAKMPRLSASTWAIVIFPKNGRH